MNNLDETNSKPCYREYSNQHNMGMIEVRSQEDESAIASFLVFDLVYITLVGSEYSSKGELRSQHNLL